jgi:hypothetical protein
MHNALNDEVNGLMLLLLSKSLSFNYFSGLLFILQLFLLSSMANSYMCLLEKFQGIHLMKDFHLFLIKFIYNVINAKISIYAL